jgi:hypothetical protein
MLHANKIGANAVAQGRRNGPTCAAACAAARGARRSKSGPRIAALWFENEAVGMCRAEAFEPIHRGNLPSLPARADERGCRIDPRDTSAKRRCANPGIEMQTMRPSNDAKDAPRISGRDIALIRHSRTKSKYSQLTTEERSVYERVHNSLSVLGATVQHKLGAYGAYGLKVTSGFTTRSGVRGNLPKDLWFGVYNQQNMIASVGNPQLFMIASQRGIEYGFSASIHPARFSDRALQQRVRSAAPRIFAALPDANSEPAVQLQKKLANGWYFRRRARLRPNAQEFLRSMLGFRS